MDCLLLAIGTATKSLLTMLDNMLDYYITRFSAALASIKLVKELGIHETCHRSQHE